MAFLEIIIIKIKIESSDFAFKCPVCLILKFELIGHFHSAPSDPVRLTDWFSHQLKSVSLKVIVFDRPTTTLTLGMFCILYQYMNSPANLFMKLLF